MYKTYVILFFPPTPNPTKIVTGIRPKSTKKENSKKEKNSNKNFEARAQKGVYEINN